MIDIDVVEADGAVAHPKLAGAGSPTSTSSQRNTSGPPCSWMRMALGMAFSSDGEWEIFKCTIPPTAIPQFNRSHRRVLRNSRNHGPSPQSSGCQECCTVRNKPLWMRHQDGETAVAAGQSGDTTRRAEPLGLVGFRSACRGGPRNAARPNPRQRRIRAARIAELRPSSPCATATGSREPSMPCRNSDGDGNTSTRLNRA